MQNWSLQHTLLDIARTAYSAQAQRDIMLDSLCDGNVADKDYSEQQELGTELASDIDVVEAIAELAKGFGGVL